MLNLFSIKKCLLAVFLVVLAPAVFAVDFQCSSVGLKRYEEVICEYAILNFQYKKIYRQQMDLMKAGRISQEAIDSWREGRNLCSDVACMDSVFAEWAAIEDRMKRLEVVPRPQERDVLSIGQSSTWSDKVPETQQYLPSVQDIPATPAIDLTNYSAGGPGGESAGDRVVGLNQVSSGGGEAVVPDEANGGGAAFIVAILAIGVLRYLFNGKSSGGAGGRVSRSRKVEDRPSIKRYLRRTESCARCDYWSGSRDVELGNTVLVKKTNLQGKCLLGGGVTTLPTKADFRCRNWRKWGALVE